MNHIYKVIWSRVKNSYVVVPEIAGTAKKSGGVRISKNVLAAALTAFLLTGISVSPVSAAIDGVNTFVEPGNQNIKIGNDIDLRNNSTKNGAIAIGDHAQIDDYVMQEGSIAIGKNAFVENMYGRQEKNFKFGQSNEKKWASSVAIGQNSYARSGSVMIGDHKYIGKLGDVEVDGSDVQKVKSRNVNINATTVGANSYNQGAFSSVTGTYSIISGKYNGSNWSSYAGQNFGATITGSLNSIESATSSSAYSGVANSIVGTANRTANSNGSLIFGAGNEITNSISSISAPSTGGDSAQALQKSLMTAVKNSNSGGATLAIGGGNTADWTQLSQIIGVNNTLKGTDGAISKFNMIDGYKNTVTKAEHVSVIGSENTVENSKSQTVIGDSNKITDRNAGTVSGKQEERTKNVSDLVIGKGNKIKGNSTYMKGYESLTVIGNNNEMVNPGAGIVIGDNQKVGAIRESVVIGSMTPEEKADPDIKQKHASVVVGYHAQSGTRDGGGMNVALGHGAKAYGWQETVTGIKSIVESGDSGYDGYLASVYGGLNTVASNKADQNDGMANTVVGTLNKTEGANGALVFGAGNSVTHSFGTAPTDENGNSMNEYWGDIISFEGQGYAGGTGQSGHDELRKAMGLAMSTGGGSVVTMGNGNTSDYAVHSQIIGSGNILTGTANTPSINNTISGYGNTGRNVERMSMMGTGNNMSGSTADVVIGDYHHKDGGKNNVILGSMATEKKTVTKTYTRKDASGNVIREKKYKVTENVPIKSHTANISNAVMLGYNTDVEKDGGVAIGADSVASVGKAATPTSAAVTRQITNVAAGTQDTDAVNVAQLKKVQAAADASKVHYYSAKSTKTGAGSNYDNDGAEAEDSIVLGISSYSKGVNSTVLGNNNKLTGVKNGRNNSIVAGQNLEVEGAHNAVFGTDYNNYDHKLTKVFGEENTVIGLGNLVGYTAEKDPSDPTKWIYTKNSSGSDQNVAVGMTNTANGGSVVVGTSSEAENLGVSFGHGNKVIGSNSGGGQRGLALGNYLTVKGEEAVAVGTNASATANWAIAMGKNSKAEKETAMAFGYDSHAKVFGGVALGSWSVADTAAGVSGYDPSTKAASTDTSVAWKSTVGAVSVGDASKGITRQITGVAAGTADTDAVNVAQLKKVEATAAAAKTNVTAGDNVTVTHDSTTNTYKVSAKDTYTTGGTYDAATKKIKFTQNDPSKNYEVDVSGLVGSGGTGSLTFAGDTGSAITKNSGETLQITGGATEVAAANNIGVVSENGKLNLKLAKNIDLGSDGSIKTGDTKMDNKGLAIQGGPSVTKGGIDAGSKKITHVAAGEISATSTDAVNGSQLQAVKNDVQNNTQNIYNMGKKVGELGTRINKVGAGAAALAALHPLDFDPHDKWDIAAGFGNYRNASAAAVGLFYRPNERTMMSLGWTMGDDRNMINAGISVKLGRGDVYTRYSKVEMANQIKDLKEKNDKMQAENKEMRSELDELKAQVAALAAKK
ncbi:ESPR-type extended signal peptide-containing protein [Dialister invisus]|uniref:ESPR-type extended signal peptide-containing protein n=1 Tax=Dialister invisus TaxID=218538 RepID=UPI00307B88C7